MSERGHYNPEKASKEAYRMNKKIEKGEASSYQDAETIIDAENKELENCEIRPVYPDDWEKFRDIWLEATKNDPEAFRDSHDDLAERTEAEWREATQEYPLEGKKNTTLTAEDSKGNVIGMTNFFKVEEGLAQGYGAYANPKYRGTGLIDKLWDKREEHLRQAGFREIQLVVSEHRTTAMEKYRQLGFKTVESFDITMGDGTPAKGHLMRREITSETPQKERSGDLKLEDVVAEVKAGIPAEIKSADREALETRQKKLTDLPYMSGQKARDVLDYKGEDEGFMMVDTDAIIGSVSPAFKNWSTEYESRRGRTADVAEKLIEGTEESIDYVFHVKNDPANGIKLKKLSGPDGDLFFVEDGTHRVAGSKLARLPRLPAQVENMSNLSEVRTTDEILKSDWERMIRKGLIKGTIEETDASGTKFFNLKIDSQVLPWMNLPQWNAIKLTEHYLERYPGSLNDVKSLTTGEIIPKKALLDMVAMNFYLAGRWEEYRQKE